MALVAWPVWQRIEEPFPHTLQGEIQAWSGLMAESMEEHGFLESRFMPHVDVHPETRFPDFRWYPTHPVLDVVIRATLVRFLGASEATMRYQGLFGCLLASFALYFLTRRRIGDLGAVVAACAMSAAPLWAELAHLSLHHPLCLGIGLSAMAWYERGRERERPGVAVLFALLFLAMQMDWPGYFFPFLIWLRQLRPSEGQRDRRLLLGLPILVIASLGLLWAHVDLIAGHPGLFLERVLHASDDSPVAGLFTREGILQVLSDQRTAFGWYGLALVVAALAVALGDRRRPERLRLWGLLFALGALNFLAFPAKAPAHDFWGAYWLPLVGFSWGIALDVLAGQLRRLGMRGAAPALLFAACLGLVTLSWLREPRAEYPPKGAYHAQLAQVVLSSIPPKDRGFFVTTATGYNAKLLTSYLRVQIVPMPSAGVDEIAKLPELAKKQLFHLEGKTCLVHVPSPGAQDGDAARREKLVAFLRRVGRPYDSPVATFWFDVTDWVWAN